MVLVDAVEVVEVDDDELLLVDEDGITGTDMTADCNTDCITKGLARSCLGADMTTDNNLRIVQYSTLPENN